MRSFLSRLFGAIILCVAFSSCGKEAVGGGTEYYVRYEAKAVSEIVAADSHPIIVVVPAVFNVRGNSVTCYCKDALEEEFGPFRSGEKVSIMVADSPDEQTYTMSIYVKCGKDGMYNLVSQGKYGASYVMP